MITTKMGAFLLVGFIAGAFIASPELRAFAANTVGSADIINNSIQSVDIKDGEVKAADIATDAVGAAELQGVTKLLFGECVLNSSENYANITHGLAVLKSCNISGVDSDDFATATFTKGSPCFAVSLADTQTGSVNVVLRNVCSSGAPLKPGDSIAVIVYDK